MSFLRKEDIERLTETKQEEPVFWKGRYWTGLEHNAFQEALNRSQAQWAETDKRLKERYLGDISIRFEDMQDGP